MNSAHLHLLLNQVPTIGTVIGLGLFLLALVRTSEHLKRASLEVFCVIALMALPTYLSGNVAQEAVANDPAASQPLIQTHRDAALQGLVLMEITGVFAWFALWQFGRASRSARWNLAAVLLCSVLTLALMARAATIGGEIHHEEIRSSLETETAAGDAAAASLGGTPASPLRTESIAAFVIARPWVWPALETFHFIGLCILLSVVLVVNLRLLGLMRHVPFAAFHRLLPWGILGFGINTVTGFLFFIAAPDQYTQNPAFYWKMLFIVLAGGNAIYLTVLDEAAVERGQGAPLTARLIATSGLFLWFGVIFWGRLMPFLGLTF